MPVIRPVLWPQDISALSDLDSSFVTNTIYRVDQNCLSFRLVVQPISPPLKKCYTFNPSDPTEQANWNHAVVAEDAGHLVGFAAAQYTAWNRRAVLLHLYVAPECRGQGVGTRLLKSVDDFAREAGARCLWVETQNVNVPALRFYLRSGFRLCGLDTSLYDPDSPVGEEVALFLERPVLFSGMTISR